MDIKDRVDTCEWAALILFCFVVMLFLEMVKLKNRLDDVTASQEIKLTTTGNGPAPYLKQDSLHVPQY